MAQTLLHVFDLRHFSELGLCADKIASRLQNFNEAESGIMITRFELQRLFVLLLDGLRITQLFSQSLATEIGKINIAFRMIVPNQTGICSCCIGITSQ